MIGWVKLHRKIVDWEWYDDHSTTRLFVHLLLTVGHEAKTYQGVEVPAGSRVCGRKKLSLETGLSEQTIRTSLKKLQESSQINQVSSRKHSIITVANWSDYQNSNQEVTSQATTKQPAQQPVNQPHLKNIRKQEGKKEEASLGEVQAPELLPAEVASKRKKTKSASRIPEDWRLSGKGHAFALGRGLTPDQIEWQVQRFVDYWKQSNSKTAEKRDWDAAWRTWAMRAVEADAKLRRGPQVTDSTQLAISNMLNKGFLDD